MIENEDKENEDMELEEVESPDPSNETKDLPSLGSQDFSEVLKKRDSQRRDYRISNLRAISANRSKAICGFRLVAKLVPKRFVIP